MEISANVCLNAVDGKCFYHCINVLLKIYISNNSVMGFAGNVGTEQLNTIDLLDFLSQNSDTEDFDQVQSEPEAEALVVSCYHGIQTNGKVQQEKSSMEEYFRNLK